MDEDDKGQEYLFKPVQSLGIPADIPLPETGNLTAVTRFVIPGLKVGKSTEEAMSTLSNKFGFPILRFTAAEAKNETGQIGSVLTFYFSVLDAGDDSSNHSRILGVSHFLIERMAGILSFSAGIKLRATQRQYCSRRPDGTIALILGAGQRSGEQKSCFTIPPSLLVTDSLSEEVFSALFWLRRGLGEVDPLISFAALMLCLQITARILVDRVTTETKCSSCGEIVARVRDGDTALVKRLLLERLGVDPKTAKQLWDYRNAVIAHGGKKVTAEVVVALTEAKFDAATFAFKALCLALKLDPAESRTPQAMFFVTDAFMNLD